MASTTDDSARGGAFGGSRSSATSTPTRTAGQPTGETTTNADGGLFPGRASTTEVPTGGRIDGGQTSTNTRGGSFAGGNTSEGPQPTGAVVTERANTDDESLGGVFVGSSSNVPIVEGARGQQGEVGPAGPAGERGLMGLQGIQGNPGAPVNGVTFTGGNSPGDTTTVTFQVEGSDIPSPVTIQPGVQGDPGDDGQPGPEGPAGPRGEPGNPGDTGQRGPSGFSVESARFTGGDNPGDTTVVTFQVNGTDIPSPITIQPGAQGNPGNDGMPGPQGIPGTAGDTITDLEFNPTTRVLDLTTSAGNHEVTIPGSDVATVSNAFNNTNRMLTTTVDGITGSPVNIPLTPIPATVVNTDFDAATRALTTTVDGVSDTSTIPLTPIPDTVVDTEFDNDTRVLTTTVDGVSDTSTIPQTIIPATLVATAFDNDTRILTTTVDGVSDTSTIPLTPIPEVTVDTDFNTTTRVLTTTVDGVSDTSAIPDTVIPATTVDLAFDTATRVLTSTVDGVSNTATIPGGTGGTSTEWLNEGSSDTVLPERITIDTDTGLQIVADGISATNFIIQNIPPFIAFNVAIQRVPNYSIFDTGDLTSRISVTGGSGQVINSLEIDGVAIPIPLLGDSFMFTRPNTIGAHTIQTAATGENSDGTPGTSTRTQQFDVFVPYFYSVGSQPAALTQMTESAEAFAVGDSFPVTATDGANIYVASMRTDSEFTAGVFPLTGNNVGTLSRDGQDGITYTYNLFNLGPASSTTTINVVTV